MKSREMRWTVWEVLGWLRQIIDGCAVPFGEVCLDPGAAIEVIFAGAMIASL